MVTRWIRQWCNARQWERTKASLKDAMWQFVRIDLRYSYFVIAAMVLFGALMNLILPHGWTVWPLVMAAGILLMMNEAADRNGEGVAPLQAYAIFFAAMLLWLASIVILQLFSPLILVLGLLAIGYYSAMGYVKDRTHQKVIAGRRAEHLCIYCGYPADYDLAMCMHCGREPDPEEARLQRVLRVPRSAADKKRTRANLTPKPPTAAVARKEQALLARRRSKRSK